MHVGTRPSGSRRTAAWSGDELAFHIGVSRRTVDNYRSGRTLPPDISPMIVAFFGDDPRRAEERDAFITAFEDIRRAPIEDIRGPPVPEDTPAPRFASLLRRHMRAGTRPAGARGIGAWSTGALARAIGVDTRTVQNYLIGRTLPMDISRILDTFFADDSRYAESRTAFLAAFEQARRPIQHSIPAQGAGPHFTISVAGPIKQAPASALDPIGNDIRRIHQLLPLVKQSAEDLAARLNPNDNAFSELARDTIRYLSEISKAEEEIVWGLIWGLGVRLEQKAAAAERDIANRLVPALEDAALAALQELRTLHAPLILATSEGRELQEQADRLQMTREEQAALRVDAVTLSTSLGQNEQIIERDSAMIVAEAAGAIGEGRHPERGTIFGIVTIKHTSIVLISAAVVAAPAYLIGGVVGAGLTMGAWEAIKKSPIFAEATAVLGIEFNRLLEAGGTAAHDRLVRLIPFRNFVRANEPQLRRIADSTPQLRWMIKYLDHVMRQNS
jgi:hypothetical protein